MLLRQIYCIVPPLHNIQITVVIYNWLIKRHVSAFFGHHQAYKEIVLIKVHSLATVATVICIFILILTNLMH